MQGGNPWTPGMFVPYRRSIGGVFAQVTIQETERDELVISTHPLEQGAPINDHAYKRPSEVTIRAGWSVAWAGDLSDVSGVYGALLAWQASLQPFDLYTGKRHYRNMLIQSINVSTDEHSEWALIAEIVCHEVIIVRTQTTTAQTMSSDPNSQKDPQSNAPQAKNGPKEMPPIPPEKPTPPSQLQSSNIIPGQYEDITGAPAATTATIISNTTGEALADKGFGDITAAAVQ